MVVSLDMSPTAPHTSQHHNDWVLHHNSLRLSSTAVRNNYTYGKSLAPGAAAQKHVAMDRRLPSGWDVRMTSIAVDSRLAYESVLTRSNTHLVNTHGIDNGTTSTSRFCSLGGLCMTPVPSGAHQEQKERRLSPKRLS